MATIELQQNIPCLCSDDHMKDSCDICSGSGNLKSLEGRLYKHHKGDVYQIIGSVLDANDGAPVVLYRRADYETSALCKLSPVYAHRLENFFMNVAPGVRRFTQLKSR